MDKICAVIFADSQSPTYLPLQFLQPLLGYVFSLTTDAFRHERSKTSIRWFHTSTSWRRLTLSTPFHLSPVIIPFLLPASFLPSKQPLPVSYNSDTLMLIYRYKTHKFAAILLLLRSPAKKFCSHAFLGVFPLLMFSTTQFRW